MKDKPKRVAAFPTVVANEHLPTPHKHGIILLSTDHIGTLPFEQVSSKVSDDSTRNVCCVVLYVRSRRLEDEVFVKGHG